MSKPIVTLSTTGPDGKEWKVHACPKCRMTAPSEAVAEQCCEPYICKCGVTCPKPYIICEACRNKKLNEKERMAFEKAEKVSWRDYDGPVCVNGDDYHRDVEEFVERCLDDGESLPLYVWSCTALRLSLNAEDIIDSALESGEHHEDAFEDIADLEGLQKFLNEWCEKQTLESWGESHKVAVLLEGAEGSQ